MIRQQKVQKVQKIGYVSKIPKTERNMHNMLKLKLLVKKGQLLLSRVTEITRELLPCVLFSLICYTPYVLQKEVIL